MSGRTTAATTPPESASKVNTPVSRMSGKVREYYNRTVSWSDWKFSAGVVAGVDAAFILFFVLQFTPIALVCYLAASAVVVGFGVRYWRSDIGQGPQQFEVMSRDKIDTVVDAMYNQINAWAQTARQIFLWKSPKMSLIAIFTLVVTGWVAGRLSLACAIFLAVNAILLKKPVLENYRRHAEPYLKPYIEEASAYVQTVVGKIPHMDKISGGKSKDI